MTLRSWATRAFQHTTAERTVVAPGCLPPSDRPPIAFDLDGTAFQRFCAPQVASVGRDLTQTTWHVPGANLRLAATLRTFEDAHAVDWLLHLSNPARQATPIIARLAALDIAMRDPLADAASGYRLHHTRGSAATADDFMPEIRRLAAEERHVLSAAGGRSSNNHLPFFTVEAGSATWVFAIGWSGQWRASLHCGADGTLSIRAGLAHTHFRLRAGETVRTPRILVFCHIGDVDETHARFRQHIYDHYLPHREGHAPQPVLFCNTCFTRGGTWLNECNAANQISLIRAYAPLQLDALVTDAGWFAGGWPAGAGNWTPRVDAYPDGIAPVAAAAAEHDLTYGLWFEPERVVAGSALHRAHPEWLLGAGPEPQETYLANFALPEVRAYFLDLLARFMSLRGFGMYRQDFNVDPLLFWQHHDAPDRQGVTEMHYVAGLYDFWDALAERWPHSLRENCASGGRRVDLEALMRMHLHQRSDYWFDNEVEQASLAALTRYLPSCAISTALNRCDDYSFHSTFAASLCVGWIADDPRFDRRRAARLTALYRRWRHLLVGHAYPLTPIGRDESTWLATQYHRADLDEGLILAFRRRDCRAETVAVNCRAVAPSVTYRLDVHPVGAHRRVLGEQLRCGFNLTIAAAPGSQLIHYRPA